MKIYPKGLYMDKPRENAPAFVKGKLSIKPTEFVDFMKENKQYINEKGYMKFDLLKSDKDGKLYFTLDTYKSDIKDVKKVETTEPTEPVYPADDIDPEDIPF